MQATDSLFFLIDKVGTFSLVYFHHKTWSRLPKSKLHNEIFTCQKVVHLSKAVCWILDW